MAKSVSSYEDDCNSEFFPASADETPGKVNDGFYDNGVRKSPPSLRTSYDSVVVSKKSRVRGEHRKHPWPNSINVNDVDIRLDWRRWLILFLFCMVTMSNAFIWISLSAITNLVERYYKIPAIWVTWLSLAFFIVPGVMTLPSAFLSAKLGLKLTIVLPAGLHAIGTAVRIGGYYKTDFLFVAVGQFIASFGTIFILGAPPYLAAEWFGDHERTTATATSNIINSFGVSVGFLLSTYLVPDSEDLFKVGRGLQIVMVSHAIFCALVFMLVLIIVQDTPAFPPSMAQAVRKNETGSSCAKQPFFRSLAFLLCRPNYWLTTGSYALNFTIVGAVPTLLSQLVHVETLREHYSISDKQIGWLGFAGPIAGSLLAIGIGLAIDKYKCYKLGTCTVLLLCAMAMTAFSMVLMHVKSVYWVGVTFIVLCMFDFPYFAYGLDHIAEISYPVAESTSATIPLMVANFLVFAATYSFQITIDYGHLDLVLYLLIGISLLALVFALLAKTKMKRQFER